MRTLVIFLALVFGSSGAWANQQAEAEVQYLLSFVEHSGCTFHRNGSDHDSADAADHLRLKYSRGGKYVNNADQFIDRLATQSSWTGRKYSVTCNGTSEPSGAWLHRALEQYRNGQ